jgi:hypothetical protein
MHGTCFDADQTRFIIPLWILVRNTSLSGNLPSPEILETNFKQVFLYPFVSIFTPPLSVFSFRQNQCPFIGGNAVQNTSGSSIKHAKNQSSKSDEFGLKTG